MDSALRRRVHTQTLGGRYQDHLGLRVRRHLHDELRRDRKDKGLRFAVQRPGAVSVLLVAGWQEDRVHVVAERRRYRPIRSQLRRYGSRESGPAGALSGLVARW